MACCSQVQAVLEEILEKLPEPFNMMEIMAKAEEKTPFVVVAFQECERMNILTQEIRRSLKELDLGLKVLAGAASPSQTISAPCGAVAGSRPPSPPNTRPTLQQPLSLPGRADDHGGHGGAGDRAVLRQHPRVLDALRLPLAAQPGRLVRGPAAAHPGELTLGNWFISQ